VGARAQHRPSYREFCGQLRKWRIDAGLTQRDVAAALGKPHSFVHKSELGERRVDVLEFIDLCRAMGLDPASSLKLLESRALKSRKT
jgi:transcriptional regulator with XRE-family HTH domain